MVELFRNILSILMFLEHNLPIRFLITHTNLPKRPKTGKDQFEDHIQKTEKWKNIFISSYSSNCSFLCLKL